MNWRVTVDDLRSDPIFPHIDHPVAAILSNGKVVAPVDALLKMDALGPFVPSRAAARFAVMEKEIASAPGLPPEKRGDTLPGSMSRPSTPPTVLAPGAADGSGSFPGAGRRPAVDERLIAPGTRAEILHGQLLWAAPADEPHGHQHFDVTVVLGTHVAGGYLGAVDMLTRTSRDDDFAPDASIYPEERDPVTGGRKLEELAFEVTDKQSMSVPTEKARELARRGVRRVFAILVKHRRVLEWSREIDNWAALSPDAQIEDRCLVGPLPVRALLEAAARDDAIGHALLARNNAVLVQALQDREARGAETDLRSILEVRGIALSEANRQRLDGCTDVERIRQWIRRAALATRQEEIFLPQDDGPKSRS